MWLELSRKAQADLDDIRDYSLAEFGVERAVAYLDAVESAFRLIVDFPEIGAVHAEVRSLREGRLIVQLNKELVAIRTLRATN